MKVYNKNFALPQGTGTFEMLKDVNLLMADLQKLRPKVIIMCTVPPLVKRITECGDDHWKELNAYNNVIKIMGKRYGKDY